MIRWADRRFALRFAGGPAPERVIGAAYARLCWQDVGRTALAVAIAWGLTWLLVASASDPPPRSAALESTSRWALVTLGIELVIALSCTLWSRGGRATLSATPTI